MGAPSRDEGSAPWFEAVPVADDLTGALALSWVARLDTDQDLVPDACVDVVWTPDGSVVVCGPEVEGWTFAASGSGGAEAVGMRFRPGFAPAALGVAMDEIRDQRVPVEDLMGADGRRLVDELAAVGTGATARERLAVVERHLRRWVDEGSSVDPVAMQVATALAADPATSVGELRDEVDLSERQLLRRCTVAFGYGPATLRRILRLQRFLALAGAVPTAGGSAHTEGGLAVLAARAGYADQPHLARDARAIARATPSELVARGRASDPSTTAGAGDGRMPA